jgi:hypothetical protein
LCLKGTSKKAVTAVRPKCPAGYKTFTPTASAPTASAPTASAPTASAPTASAPTASAPTASAPVVVIKPGTTKCGTLGEIIDLSGKKITCTQNASNKNLAPKWQYISSGTLCFTEGLFVRPYTCRYQYGNGKGDLQFMR